MLSGEDATALGFMAHGGHGCISVVSNVAPRLCADFQACPAGTTAQGARAAGPAHAAARCDVLRGRTLAGEVGWRLGLCSAETRLPLVPLSEAAKKQVDAALVGLGLVQQRAAE